MSAHPLVITACFDDATQRLLNALRLQHYPPGATVIGAHLTLFHAIAGHEEVTVARTLAQLAQTQAPFTVALPGVRSLGRGVAIDVQSKELASLHGAIARSVEHRLTRQDAQPFQPHVTIANKLLPQNAAALLATLRDSWQPREATLCALAMWHYLGPEWQLAERFELAAPR